MAAHNDSPIMTVEKPTKMKRARTPVDKLARRRHLLETAERLFTDAGGDLPSSREIAEAAGLSKGTPYLYFGSVEDIFLTLLADHFIAWMERTRSLIEVTPRPLTAEAIAAVQIGYLLDHPILLRLATISQSRLVRRETEAAVRSYKLRVATKLVELGRVFEDAVPGLAPGDGARTLLTSYAAILGLWQVAEPPPVAAQALTDPALRSLRLDFHAELPGILAALWRDRISRMSPSI